MQLAEIRHVARRQTAETFVELSPYDRVIGIWARWLRLDDKPTSGGDCNLQDVKELMQCGEAVESMVNSLPRAHWWAIRKSRGICTVWNFQNLSFGDVLGEVEQMLVPKLKINLATRKHFH